MSVTYGPAVTNQLLNRSANYMETFKNIVGIYCYCEDADFSEPTPGLFRMETNSELVIYGSSTGIWYYRDPTRRVGMGGSFCEARRQVWEQHKADKEAVAA